MNMEWGTFAPDNAMSDRRQQTLGLGSVIRHYNDRAVPGLGGLWYGMPMMWSLLGIWLAEERKARPLPCANAVEALAMSAALAAGGEHMHRGSGRRNLARCKDHSFKALSARGAYVTQPRRMGTVQPLVRLGFVNAASQRFNLYRLSTIGADMLRGMETEQSAVSDWANGGSVPQMKKLWPSKRLPAAQARLLNRQLRQFGVAGDPDRRRALLDSSPREIFAESPLVQTRPRGQVGAEHWADLRCGIAFVRLRDAAIVALQRVEQNIGAGSGAAVKVETAAAAAQPELAAVGAAAHVVLAEADSSESRAAQAFAKLCMGEPSLVLAELARRDGAVVQERPGGWLGLGPAGGSGPDGEDEDAGPSLDRDGEGAPVVPELPRIANLYALARDIGPQGVLNP